MQTSRMDSSRVHPKSSSDDGSIIPSVEEHWPDGVAQYIVGDLMASNTKMNKPPSNDGIRAIQ